MNHRDLCIFNVVSREGWAFIDGGLSADVKAASTALGPIGGWKHPCLPGSNYGVSD